MDHLEEPLSDLRTAERHAVATHEARAADAVSIYLEGFNLLLQSLHALKGYHLGEALEQRVMMALFIKTINSLRCFYELATLGYFVQAFNLMRTPVEDWMGYWFLRNLPERHGEFTDKGSEHRPSTKCCRQSRQSKTNSGEELASQQSSLTRAFADG